MAFKVGGTTVIDNSGDIDWARIKKPASLHKNAKVVATSTGTGALYTETETGMVFDADGGYHVEVSRSYYNCSNCNCDCRC